MIKTVCGDIQSANILSLPWPFHAASPIPPTKTWSNVFAILPFRPNRMALPRVSCVYTTEEGIHLHQANPFSVHGSLRCFCCCLLQMLQGCWDQVKIYAKQGWVGKWETENFIARKLATLSTARCSSNSNTSIAELTFSGICLFWVSKDQGIWSYALLQFHDTAARIA